MPGVAECQRQPGRGADAQTWFAIVAIEFAAFRGALIKLATDEPVADSTMWRSLGRHRLRHRCLLVGRQPTRLTVPAGVSKVRLKGNINWTFGGTGHRHVWMRQKGAPFYGMGRESDEGDAGVQSIGSAVVDVTPGDYFELTARQTSGATKNVAADELTWFAIEVVE